MPAASEKDVSPMSAKSRLLHNPGGRQSRPSRQAFDNAGGFAAWAYYRGTAVVSLLRRCGKIAVVAVYRSARVVWHTAALRISRRDIDQAGSLPRQLRRALEELGPTFVKLGQTLSTRSDLTPPRVQQELSKLQDHAPSIPQAKLLAELEKSLGSRPSTHFATLDMTPIAGGSIAQVHSGTLHDGLRVAVKVRRPGVRADIDADIWFLRKLLRLVAGLSSRVRAYDPVAILDEFAILLRAETDFTTEADNLEAVGRTFAASDTVAIPRVVTDMSDDSVLVMEWIEGIPLSNREGLEAAGVNRAVLARAVLHAYGVMIFQADRFHADPHPGNLIALTGDRLGLVDFGEVGSVEPAKRAALLNMMTAVLVRDGEALAAAVLALSRITRSVDRAEFGFELAKLVDPVGDATLKGVRLGEKLARLLHVLRDYGMVLPADLAILIKTLIECEATTNELDPAMSMINLVAELGTLPPETHTASRETSLGGSSD